MLYADSCARVKICLAALEAYALAAMARRSPVTAVADMHDIIARICPSRLQRRRAIKKGMTYQYAVGFARYIWRPQDERVSVKEFGRRVVCCSVSHASVKPAGELAPGQRE